MLLFKKDFKAMQIPKSIRALSCVSQVVGQIMKCLYFGLKIVFFNNKIIPNRIHKLLILDRATTHYEENLVEKFKKFNASYILIPPGLTRFLQPLDCSVNGPFKKALTHWDVEYRIDHKNTKKPSYNDLIDAVLENWCSEDKITAEIIFNSFKITGISVALDGSEKNKIILHEEVSDSIISPEDFLEDENSPTWEEDAKKVDNKAKNKGNDQKKDKQCLITNYFKKKTILKWIQILKTKR